MGRVSMHAAPVLILLGAVLAGCLGGDENVETQGSLDPADLLPWLADDDPDHDHADPNQHRAGWNMELVGHHLLSDDPVDKPAWINQLVVRDGFVYIAAYHVPPSMQPGLIVVNATDPEKLHVASTFIHPDVTPIDIFLSDDGRYAFLAGHRWTPNGQNPNPNVPCFGGLPVPIYDQVCAPYLPYGVYAVNVEDATRPHYAGMAPSVPGGAHTVKYGLVQDGPGAGEYLFLASYGFHYAQRLASSVHTFKIEPGPGRVGAEGISVPLGDELLFVDQGRYLLPPVNDPLGERGLDGKPFVHDVWFDLHPDTQQHLLYVASWDGGVHILDYTLPLAPQPVAVWDDYDGFERYGNIHSVYTPREKTDGIYYLTVAPEYGVAEHSGKLWIVDITDPGNPTTLGDFVLPGDPSHVTTPNEYIYSPHNLLIEDGIAYHGHNHAGVWAIDLSTRENLTAPKAIGFYMTVPEDPGLVPRGDHIRSAPSVWNAWVEGGTVYASDRHTGLYLLRLVERDPGAPPWEGLELSP